MNNYKSYIAGAFALLSFASCSDSFLDVQKPDGEPLEEYYVTEKRLNEALYSAYAPLHWPDWDNVGYNALNICGEIMGEDFWVGGSSNTDNQHWHMLSNFEANSNFTLGTLWTDFYSGVKRCNDVIKYVEWNRGKLADGVLDKIELQARVLRVYYYNTMWKYYGNIPFYLENLSSPYTAPQMKADEIYEELAKELDAIIDDDTKKNILPMRWDPDNSGRISKAMVYMLYAEMTMYQNDKTRLSNTFDYMKAIIDDKGNYDLNPSYANIWEESGEWCKESIWEINYNDDNAQRDWGDAARNAGGTVLPTLIAPNGWLGGDGWNAGEDGWGFLPVKVETYDMFAEGDVRRDATCWDVRGVAYTERYQDTHIWLAKYRPFSENNKDCPGSKNLNYNNNLRIYRFAETLLNAAELVVRGFAKNATEADAKKWLNDVHTRAGLPEITLSLDNIIEERHLEFVGEGKRYFDLVRLVDVPESSKNAKNTLVPDQYGYRTNSWTESKKYIPLAQGELDADPTLVQNNY